MNNNSNNNNSGGIGFTRFINDSVYCVEIVESY